MSGTQYVFKIIIAGDSGVGKTSLVRRYVDDEFIPAKKATIGIDYFLKNVTLSNLPDSDVIALQIWDLAGEEKYHTFLPSYIPGTQGVIMVYSDDVEKSLPYLYNFTDELNSLVKTKIPIILIHAKNDLETHTIDKLKVQDFMAKYKITTFIDTSSKTGENVDSAFYNITELIAKENDLT